MAESQDKGTFGEQGAGFFLGPQGYFLVEGPSGTQGHAANAPGFDGVAYNIKRDDLILYDNKAFRSDRNVGKGSAIDPAANLAQNLDALIARVQDFRDLPARYRILDLLRQTRATLTSKAVSPPPNVRIAITNFGGNSPGVTQAFAGRGIRFIDMNSAPVVPARSTRTYVNAETIPAMVQPINADVAAYGARRGRVAAVAEVTRFVAQTLNDVALKHAIGRELERLTSSIGEALVRGGGALVVINIDATSQPGNVGMVTARSISSAYVVAHPNTNRHEAVKLWEMRPTIGRQRGANEKLETQLLWITAPDIP